MADRYWVLGNGTWNDTSTANWATSSGGSAGASAPSSSDNAIFDANSGAWTLVTITGTAACNNLTVTGTAIKTHVLALSGNFTVTGALSLQGNSTINRIIIQASPMGTIRTLSAGSLGTMSNVDFQDLSASGGGGTPWNLSAISGGSGDCGGNSNITFTTPVDQHFLNVNGGTWSTVGNWTSRIPLPQDNVFFDLAFGASKTVTADMKRLGASIDWTGATWTTALTWTNSLSNFHYGHLTLISGLTIGSTAVGLFPSGRGSFNITSHGVTFNFPVAIQGGNGTTTYTLADNLTLASTLTFSVFSGSLVCGSNVFSAGLFTQSSGSSISLGSATHLLTGVGTVWSGGGTITAGTSTIKCTNTSNTAITFAGVSKTYNNVWFSRGASTGSITISGSNTFADLKDDGTAAHSLLVTAGTTQTFSTFTVSGTVGNLITITSTTTATYAFTRPAGLGGRISRDYLDIAHCVATPVNTWFAGANSVDSQATATAGSGWIFKAPQATSKARAFLVGAT